MPFIFNYQMRRYQDGTNHNLGRLFRASFGGGEGGKITPCLKLVRIMLEASKLARKYIPICSFRKYTF